MDANLKDLIDEMKVSNEAIERLTKRLEIVEREVCCLKHNQATSDEPKMKLDLHVLNKRMDAVDRKIVYSKK